MPPMPERPGLRTLLRALGRRRPRARGTLRVDGLEAGVTVRRDRWGIPHVEAANDHDAWFGLGFCHGQDRGFQLELLARAGRGALAEILGLAALPIDRLSRTLGFRRVATAQLPLLEPGVLATLEAYAAGVNAAAAASPRPHELVLLRARRTRWEAVDVLAFQGLQSLSLAGSWDAELARLTILLADGPDALAAVDQPYPDWLPVVTPVGASAGPTLYRLADDIELLRDIAGGPGASNAWAIAGPRTCAGAPLLANDPHLAPGVPPPWYLAHLRTPDWGVAGASFVGGPAFPSGHNGHAAWGITAACTDAVDMFWEELDATTGTARGPDGPEPLMRRLEEIAVRGAPAVIEEVVETARGPVVTPLLDGVSVALSLAATWLRPAPVRGFLEVHRARDFATFRDAFADWPGPALNVVYADAGGHIGWQLIGSLPRRRTGNGTLPLPAWVARWHDDLLPYEDLPWTLDPPAGFVASANNAPRPDAADEPFLGVDWLDGYRAARIVEVLAAHDAWDVEACARLQVDVTSLPWRELRDAVLAAAAGAEETRTAGELLSGWDGLASQGSAAASVFELFMAELASALTRRSASNGWRSALGGGFGPSLPRTVFGARTAGRVVAALRDGGDHAPLIRQALHAALATLTARSGADASAWAWGRIRPLRLLHPLGVARPLDRVLNLGPVAVGGDTNTVAQAGVQPLDPLGNPAAIANQRSVIDLADVERSRFALAGGQSGNPLSPQYGDLFELWQRGQGVPIAWSSEAVAAATVATLTLEPSRSP